MTTNRRRGGAYLHQDRGTSRRAQGRGRAHGRGAGGRRAEGISSVSRPPLGRRRAGEGGGSRGPAAAAARVDRKSVV